MCCVMIGQNLFAFVGDLLQGFRSLTSFILGWEFVCSPKQFTLLLLSLLESKQSEPDSVLFSRHNFVTHFDRTTFVKFSLT